MSVLVILIFTMTSRIFAGEYAKLNDSVSTNVDSKRPHIILQFNFSKVTYSQQRTSRYNINRTNKTRNEVEKAFEQAGPVFSEVVPIKPSQLLGTDETKRIWRRKRLRKRLRTVSKHVSNDLGLLGVNSTQMKDVKLGQDFDEFSEEGPQSSRKFKDRMNVQFFKERTQNPKEKELNSSKTLRPIRPRILQTQRNRTSSRELLQQPESSLRKAQRNKLIFRRSVGLTMLRPVAQDVQSLAMELFAKWSTSIKGKSVRYYKKCHDRLRAAFNRISEHDETLKQNNTITLLSLLSRSKRHTKSRNLKAPREETEEKAKTKSTEEKKQQTRKKAKPAKPTDTEELNEDEATTADPNEKHHKNFMQAFVNRLFDDVKDSKHDDDQQKKLTAETEDPLDVKIKEFNQFRTEISRAVEVEATSVTSPRALNGSDETEREPDRFSAAKQVEQAPRIVFYFRKTTTKEPEAYDATYAILIGLGVCIAILLCAICIVLCVNKSSAKPKEQEPLIIFTARPTDEEQMFDDIDRQNERRQRRMRRRLARESYIQLHTAPTWPLDQHTGHAAQPRSESPRQIQSAVVAPLNESTVAPVSPVPVPASPSKVELPAAAAAPAPALKPQGN